MNQSKLVSFVGLQAAEPQLFFPLNKAQGLILCKLLLLFLEWRYFTLKCFGFLSTHISSQVIIGICRPNFYLSGCSSGPCKRWASQDNAAWKGKKLPGKLLWFLRDIIERLYSLSIKDFISSTSWNTNNMTVNNKIGINPQNKKNQREDDSRLEIQQQLEAEK